mmetsp:Transcript_32441/g.60340  ORF Transcript_32441/g.60340 Transcript_32441/m.60340 type:complete len:348 (-) Transcript_32441:146-1189(-)
MAATAATAAKVAAALAIAGFIKKKLGPYTEEKHALPSRANADEKVRKAHEQDVAGHWALRKQRFFKNKEGLLIHTRTYKPPRKTRVRGVAFLVHGFMEHSGRYAHVIESLNKTGLVVHTFDHQGHGQSQGDRAHVREFQCYVDDLLQVVRSLSAERPRLKRFLIAHSMGGLVATGAASLAPELFDGLVLCGPWLDLDDHTKRQRPFLFPLLRVIDRVLPKLVVSPGIAAEYISSDPVVVAHYLNDPLNCAATGVRARLLISVVEYQDKLRKDKYSKVSMPLLVMHGTADKLTNPQGSKDLCAMCPSADKTLKLLPKYAHEVLNEPHRDAKGSNPAISIMNSWIRSRL